MATIVLGGVGAAIGSTIPGVGTMTGLKIGMVLGSVVDEMQMARQNMASISDLKIGGSAYGSAIPRIWGKVRLAGQSIWVTQDAYGRNLFPHDGGKGKTPSGEWYSCTWASMFAETTYYARDPSNPLGGALIHRPVTLLRVWLDNELVWDSTASHNKLLNNTDFFWHDGSETQAIDPIVSAYATANPALSLGPNAWRGRCYLLWNNLNLQDYGNRIPNVSVEVQTTTVTLGDVFIDLCRMVGLQPSQIDASLATTTVTGMICPNQEAPDTTLKALSQFYAHDIVEYDGKVWLIPRGGAVAASISNDDLGAVSGGGDAKRMKRTRTMRNELPGRIQVQYNDVDINHQNGNALAANQSADLYNTLTVSLPVTLSAFEAVGGAYRILDGMWQEAEAYEFSLPIKWLGLTPADPIDVPIDGVTTRVRLTEVKTGPLSEIQCQGVLEGVQTVSQTSLSGSSGGGVMPIVSAPVASIWDAWSGIEIADADQAEPGFYVLANGGAGWSGGTIYWSSDAGANWIQGPNVSSAGIWGAATGALSSAGAVANAFDNTNTVGVDISATGGQLASDSDSAILAGGNYALLGGELLQFGTATLTTANHYTLSHIKRGERSSPMTGHANGEGFAMLGGVIRVPVDPSLAGATVRVKVVSRGQLITDVTTYTSVVIASPTPTRQSAINAAVVRPVWVSPQDLGTLTTDNTWRTLNVSSYVQTGAVAVILDGYCRTDGTPDNADQELQARANSSGWAIRLAKLRGVAGAYSGEQAFQAVVPLSNTATFDYKGTAAFTTADLRVIGYWAAP